MESQTIHQLATTHEGTWATNAETPAQRRRWEKQLTFPADSESSKHLSIGRCPATAQDDKLL